jgi:hypothetical protein
MSLVDSVQSADGDSHTLDMRIADCGESQFGVPLRHPVTKSYTFIGLLVDKAILKGKSHI